MPQRSHVPLAKSNSTADMDRTVSRRSEPSSRINGCEPEAPLFDVCSAVCDTPPEAEESALVHALAYFEGVLGCRIADINHITYLQARASQ
jgi:hypothetical protein